MISTILFTVNQHIIPQIRDKYKALAFVLYVQVVLRQFLRENIESQMNQISTSQNKIGWQHYIQNKRQELKNMSKKPSFIVWLLPLLYFILPSISCIIVYIFMSFGNIAKLPIPIEISLLVIGVIFIICLIISWFRAAKVILR